MQQLELPRAKRTDPLPNGLPSGFPVGSEIQHIAFVPGDSPAQTTLLKFTQPRACKAILTSDSAAVPDLSLLLVPSSDHEDAERLASVWDWVEPGVPPDRRQGYLITLQGVRVVWSAGRAGIIAPPDRLETLRLAIVEFAFHDGEVRSVEQAVAQAWPEVEADAPLAFQFDERDTKRREELAHRFQQILSVRSRLVRINPVIHRPPVHPPTLAGQLGERLKERTRLVERIEFLGGQVETIERVYEMCAQRLSEHTHSRKETTLEWVIIVLLSMETIILLIDLMARLGK